MVASAVTIFWILVSNLGENLGNRTWEPGTLAEPGNLENDFQVTLANLDLCSNLGIF